MTLLRLHGLVMIGFIMPGLLGDPICVCSS